jgi:hypothetical protein
VFGIAYLKAPPTTHVIQFKRGKPVRQGAGLSLLYFAPTSVIVQVPLASTDVPFVFNEVTKDFQDATIQGELTFRVVQPVELASLLDFSIDTAGRHRSDDPTKLNERIIRAAQILARSFTQERLLRDVLVSSNHLVDHVLGGLRQSPLVTSLGVEILGFSVLSIKATPEMAKALQADAREKLLQHADEAVYARRNMAVELERQIKENELNTEIAVAHKTRQVRETKLQADIALEKERTALVDQQVENQRKESQARAEALQAVLEPLKTVDWRTLMAVQSDGLDPRKLVAMAFRDMADNADKIGNLNISPDLLSSLLAGVGGR